MQYAVMQDSENKDLFILKLCSTDAYQWDKVRIISKTSARLKYNKAPLNYLK